MLRASIRSSRAFGCKSNAASLGRQWHAVQLGRASSGGLRGYAAEQKPSIADSKPAVLPGSASPSTSQPLPPGTVATSINATNATPATPSSGSTIPQSNIPLTPPPPSSTPPPRVPPPKPKRRFFRKFFTTLIVLTTLGFGGGVYYSRINDNFHDFFTEYIPFGEEAVLYLEEREFRNRYPRIGNRAGSGPRDTGNTVKISSQSGVSWKVAEDGKSGSTGRHANASRPDSVKVSEALQTPTEKKLE
jgi:mitofilin